MRKRHAHRHPTITACGLMMIGCSRRMFVCRGIGAVTENVCRVDTAPGGDDPSADLGGAEPGSGDDTAVEDEVADSADGV